MHKKIKNQPFDVATHQTVRGFAQGKNSKLKIIDQIVARAKEDLEKRKKNVPFTVLLNSFQDPPHANSFPRGERERERVKKTEEQRFSSETNRIVHYTGFFEKAIKHPKSGKLALIAEVKLASPTESYLGTADDISTRVKMYEQAGADCISVATERHFFKGDPEFVRQIKSTISLPVLQKDFIIDPYQAYEIKKNGADAILFIARIVSKQVLIALVQEAKTIGLEVVVEVNNQDDLEKALATKTEIIAVNARDLDTFEIDVGGACRLLKMIPDKFIKLGFSGVKNKDEVEKYKQAGADGVLIGTSLMKTDNIEAFIKNLV